MKTFIEHLQERAGLAAGLLSAGMAFGGDTTPASEHTVESGNTVSSIARQRGIKVADLLKYNPSITDPNKISIGQKINLGAPAVTTTPAATPAATPVAAPAAKPPTNAPTYMDRWFSAIASRETGSSDLNFKDEQFIRTKVLTRTDDNGKVIKSSAFGPMQVTYSTVADHMKRHPELFDEDLMSYGGKIVTQGRKFMAAQDNDEKYGCGKGGDLCTAKDNPRYYDLVKAVAHGKLLDRNIDPNSQFDINSATQSWRGFAEDKDPKYFSGVRDAFKLSEPKPEPKTK